MFIETLLEVLFYGCDNLTWKIATDINQWPTNKKSTSQRKSITYHYIYLRFKT